MRKWRFRHPPDVRFIGLRLSMTGGWRRSARACGFCLPIAPTSIPSSRVRQDQGAAARQSHSCAPSRRSGTSSHDRGLRDSGGVQKFHTPRRLCPVRTKVLVSGDPDGGCDRLRRGQSIAITGLFSCCSAICAGRIVQRPVWRRRTGSQASVRRLSTSNLASRRQSAPPVALAQRTVK